MYTDRLRNFIGTKLYQSFGAEELKSFYLNNFFLVPLNPYKLELDYDSCNIETKVIMLVLDDLISKVDIERAVPIAHTIYKIYESRMKFRYGHISNILYNQDLNLMVYLKNNKEFVFSDKEYQKIWRRINFYI
jgi:hypothetical protein